MTFSEHKTWKVPADNMTSLPDVSVLVRSARWIKVKTHTHNIEVIDQIELCTASCFSVCMVIGVGLASTVVNFLKSNCSNEFRNLNISSATGWASPRFLINVIYTSPQAATLRKSFIQSLTATSSNGSSEALTTGPVDHRSEGYQTPYKFVSLF